MLVFLSLIKDCKIYGLRHGEGEGEGVTLAEGMFIFMFGVERASKKYERERERDGEKEREGEERDSSLIPPKTTRYRRRMKARDMSQGFR